jgi:DNA repair protein RadA/Sms
MSAELDSSCRDSPYIDHGEPVGHASWSSVKPACHFARVIDILAIMAKKPRTRFECSNCGHEEAKWLGRCPACGEWNTMVEHEVQQTASGGGRASAGASRGRDESRTRSRPEPIGAIEASDEARASTGMAELDRVLGGGIVAGSSVLVGGEPGIGKSTLMLQMAAQMRSRSVLYVTGEESAQQIRLRADRLGVSNPGLEILAENELERITTLLSPRTAGGDPPYSLVVVDSIQTVYSAEAGSVPGTPNQVKYTTFEIAESAREHGIAVFFVAHVTKEGSIAGPKTIEHMVDTVLYFEQSDDETRYLRASKNRFGSTDEIGLFTMQPTGLIEITDPNSVFLVRRSGSLPAGVVVAPVIEGSRVLLVEVQSLTVPAKGGISRVFSDRVDSGRVSRMAAVLEKHIGLSFSDHDIYVNVAGGMRIRDVGVELPLAVALYSARTDRVFPSRTTIAGELSLAGEIRPVPQMARRARTASDVGFDRCFGPASVRQSETGSRVTWTGLGSLEDAVERLFGSS